MNYNVTFVKNKNLKSNYPEINTFYTRGMKDRIQRFIDFKGISAGELASSIDVQRSNVSHILNGRNKPGALFLEKLLLKYPEINARWLMTGEGEMISENIVKNENQPDLIDFNKKVIDDNRIKNKQNYNTISGLEPTLKNNDSSISNSLKRIIMVYEDNSFEILLPKNNQS